MEFVKSEDVKEKVAASAELGMEDKRVKLAANAVDESKLFKRVRFMRSELRYIKIHRFMYKSYPNVSYDSSEIRRTLLDLASEVKAQKKHALIEASRSSVIILTIRNKLRIYT